MRRNYIIFFTLLLVGSPISTFGQEIKIFSISDFDLRGKVKKCLVRTNYGKEEYEFSVDGFLTKSVTRYNDQDYDLTYYKYKDNELIEKRLEIYRDEIFDKTTSIANFYSKDTTVTTKITEKIVSYSEEFLDQYEYIYDQNDTLVKIVRTNDNGIDVTEILHTEINGELTKTYTLNGIILQSVRTSRKTLKDKSVQNIILTKNYLNGEPTKAVEKIYNGNSKLVSKTDYFFDETTKQFGVEAKTVFLYDEQDMLLKVEITRGEITETKKYMFQFDANEKSNWVKEIISPDNSYITRKIIYYPVEKVIKEN